jgi:multiple antibiotic resistance protein
MNDFLQAFVSLLAITNPIVAAPLYLGIVAGMAPEAKRRGTLQASLAVFAILATSTLFGRAVLELFGISMEAFRSAGGLVIILVGLEMLRGRVSGIQQDEASPNDPRDRLFVPFAMPLVAGPGAITTALTLAISYPSQLHIPIVPLLAAMASSAVLWLVLRLSVSRHSLVSPRAERIITRFMGLILVAIGFQIGLQGLRDFFVPTLAAVR